MNKLADVRVVIRGGDDLALNPESVPVSTLQPQKIRSSKCYLPQHHNPSYILNQLSLSISFFALNVSLFTLCLLMEYLIIQSFLLLAFFFTLPCACFACRASFFPLLICTSLSEPPQFAISLCLSSLNGKSPSWFHRGR